MYTQTCVWFFLKKIVRIHVPDRRWDVFTTIHWKCKTSGWWNLKSKCTLEQRWLQGKDCFNMDCFNLIQWTTHDEYKLQELRPPGKCVIFNCEGIYVKKKSSLHILTAESCLRWKESYHCATWSTTPCILIPSTIRRWATSFSPQPPYLQGPFVPSEEKAEWTSELVWMLC